MKQKNNKYRVKTSLLVDFFSMPLSVVNRHLRSGLRLDCLYIVLNRPDLTTKQKRDFVFNTSMSFSMKENIWNRFQGDYGFAYCKQKSNSLEFRV